MPRARPDATTRPAVAKIAAPVCPRICGPAPRHCARRRSRPFRARADRGMAEHRDDRRRRIERRRGRAENPARRRRSCVRRACASASNLARASSSAAGCACRCRRRAAPGAAIRRAPRSPSRSARSGAANVTGPTFCVRASRSQARRSVSLKVFAFPIFAPIRGSSPRNRRRIFSRCMKIDQHRQQQRQRRISGCCSEQQEIDRRQRGGDQRGQRRDARDQRDRRASGQRQQSDRPVQRQRNAEEGRDALAALEAQPDGKEMAEERAKPGEQRRDPAAEMPRETAPPPRPCRRRTASVAAAAHFLPVRSTLVAPILPEPILRTSPAPESAVKIRPNGIEPSR